MFCSFFFFFSSRRRHTRCGRDWSSDVCSSDLRELSHRLYAGGPDHRVRQEWILGVGGVRVLRALGYDPAAWHANEGHAAFMLVERVREQMAEGATLPD